MVSSLFIYYLMEQKHKLPFSANYGVGIINIMLQIVFYQKHNNQPRIIQFLYLILESSWFAFSNINNRF